MKKISILVVLLIMFFLCGCNHRCLNCFNYALTEEGYYEIVGLSVGVKKEKLVIPDFYNDIKVVGIKRNAICNNNDIKEIYLSKNIRIIENNFNNLYNLKKIILNNVEIISNSFQYCVNLKKIVIPKEMLEINYSFNNCYNLKKIEYEDECNITLLNGFNFCESLEKTIIPNTIKQIYAFNYCTLLQKIVFEEQSELLSLSGFNGCIKLKSIEIPNSVQQILNAFQSVNIVSIDIPVTVEYINNAFNFCKQLEKINFENNSKLKKIYGFNGCEKLEELIIPKSVEIIGDDIIDYNEYNGGSFDNCGITAVQFEDNSSCRYIKGFRNCESLRCLALPQSLEVLGRDSFNEGLLENLIIPKNVRKIGRNVFSLNSNLKNVYFENNSLLEEIYISSFNMEYKDIVRNLPEDIYIKK